MKQKTEAQLDSAMIQIEVNIDDMNPEAYEILFDILLQAGANDVWLTPIIMKKGRPAIALSVLCSIVVQSKMEELIFTNTTTFGLRFFPVTCHRLAYQFQTCKTSWGEVQVREGFLNDKRITISPEYEDCRQIVKEFGISLQEVYQSVYQSYGL